MKKINHKVLYLLLGLASSVIGLVLIPFSSSNSNQQNPLRVGQQVAHAEHPGDGPDGGPGPCPLDGGPDPCPGL